ncbi:ATP-binding protein [Janthinobacterium fluminis]|uniref:histidine kinase n=1 Tax=Janthinobacterium fluminis TaxID=2987524 RepID=A0ABT5K5K1_9BURK|nr:ATP-binding protein [Janthinobacterium fluminis]MDC8760282.1 ATP-binding protein [Janthinobacterium fluminis]
MRAFLGSMTGRVFLALLIGMAASAALTQWLAVNERQRAIEQYRDFHALERAEQLVTTADVVPASSREAYLKLASRGSVRLEVRAGAPAAPELAQTDFSAALGQRLGAGFKLVPLAERPAACDRPRRPSTLFGPTQWGGACESMQVRMRDGQWLGLSVLPPRGPPGRGRYEWTTWLPFLASIAALAYLVTRMTMRPLKHLAQAARDLGNDINHPPLALSGASEIRQASAAFNAMQARIRQHIFQRTQMLAAITHDLQTPLTRLRLRLEKVAEPELHDRLVGDLSAMQDMVKEGLDLARSMDTTETMQALDLDSLLDSVCCDAADAGQRVCLSGRAGMALMGRPMALRRCLVNLIDNAVKYGQRADVSVERMAGAARVRIRDAGPGIAQELMAKVFEPFYRIETSRSRESGGTGLGLTIARNIAEQHGATVQLANHPGGGLEVTLVVPEYYAGN